MHHADSGSVGACAFPANQGITPLAATCCSSFGGPDADLDGRCDGDAAGWVTSTWQEIGFSLSAPHSFTYAVETRSTADGLLFEARAHGDTDCDMVQSTFKRFAREVDNPGACEAEIIPGTYIEKEIE